MKPLFVRELSDPDRQALQAGLRSSDGFTVRRCHILLASARGGTTTATAQAAGRRPAGGRPPRPPPRATARATARAAGAAGWAGPLGGRGGARASEARGLGVVAMQSRRPHAAAK